MTKSLEAADTVSDPQQAPQAIEGAAAGGKPAAAR
jgi:hypothetical protein